MLTQRIEHLMYDESDTLRSHRNVLGTLWDTHRIAFHTIVINTSSLWDTAVLAFVLMAVVYECVKPGPDRPFAIRAPLLRGLSVIPNLRGR